MGNSKLKIVRTITDLPPTCYRLSTDGRKWKSLCEARQKLANWLALKGNPDGTQIFPGTAKMVRVMGWSRSKVFYVLSDLELIGCVVNQNMRTKERGTSLRRFDPAPLLKANETLNSGVAFSHPTVQDSPNLESNIQELESKIEKPRVQDTAPQSRIEEPKSNPALDSTVLDRPIKPTNTTVKNKTVGAVEWLSRLGHKKLGSFSISKAHQRELQTLSDRDGFEMFKQVCKRWFKERDFTGLRYPAGQLPADYEGHLFVIQEEERFKKYLDEQAEDRRKQFVVELKPQIVHIPDDPFCSCPDCEKANLKIGAA